MKNAASSTSIAPPGDRLTPPRRSPTAAFTLIELLVVVAILALLLSILVPSLVRAKELARRAICAANEHQAVVAFQTYAAENRAFLPKLHWNDPPMGKQHHPCPYFYDTPMADKLVSQYLGDYRILYCPSYLINNQYNERGYCRSDPQYGNNHDAGWWWYAWPKLAGWVDYWRVTSYNVTNHPAIAAAYRTLTINDDPTRILLFDMNNTNTGFSDPWSGWVRTHWGKGIPEGQNVTCVDGHTSWQVFNNVSPQFPTDMSPKYFNGNDVWWW